MRTMLVGALTAVALLPAAPAAAADGAVVAIAPAGQVRFDMASRSTGRTYRVFVQRPTGQPPARGWPVMVVTDGNGLFASAASAERIAELTGKSALIVGVGYASDVARSMALRTRDLTPQTLLAHIRANPGQPPPKVEDYGGSEGFYRFLVDELRPRIAAAYRVDAGDQTLYGHSLGGLFTLGVLFAHPASFRSYVASSPSIWWDGRAVLKGEAAWARQVEAGAVAPRVLVLVGGREQEPIADPLPPGLSRADADKIAADSRMVDNASELGARLAHLKGAGGYVSGHHVLADEDHISVLPASLARGVRFAEGAAP